MSSFAQSAAVARRKLSDATATILVVDDHTSNRKFLVTLLRYHGHRLLEAVDGAEALAGIRAERPDLVITDVLMPVMDGYELVRQLRLDPATSTIPVVFYTAHYGEHEARVLALSGGVSDVLAKPAESANVLQVVARVLNGKAAASPPAADLPLAEFHRAHLRLLTDKLSAKATDLRNANARLRALVNIALDFASSRDSDQRLQRTCSSLDDLFSATYVTVGITDPQTRTVQQFVTCGTENSHWIGKGDVLGGLLDRVVSGRAPARGTNPGGDAGRLGLPPRHPAVHAYLAAPIASVGHTYGWICLVDNEGRTFSEEDEHLVTALSSQIGSICELECEILDRKEAEAALRTERNRAQRYLDTPEVIMLALDLERRVTLANRYACSLVGWAAEELCGRDWIETCLPERIRPAIREKFRKLLLGDMTVEVSPVMTRTGQERLIEWHNTLLRDAAGEVIGTFSSGTDITERTNAEAEIRHRAQLSSLSTAVGLALTDAASLRAALQRCIELLVAHLDAALACIWILDDAASVLELQASGGRSPHPDPALSRIPLGASLIGRIAAERKPHVTNAVGGDREVDNKAWAERERIVAFAGYPLVVEGRVVGVMALYARHALSDTDLSALASVADHIALGIERISTAAALQVSEERMRFALQSAGVGTWDWNCMADAVRLSETCEAMHGLEPGTFGGTFEAYVARIHPDDRAATVEAIERAMKTGADYVTHYRSLRHDGTWRSLDGAGRVYSSADGVPMHGIGIVQDVTDRLVMEEQYRQSQKMEAVGRLAGGVAHDFNNLLTAILGYCELLLADLDPEDRRRADIGEIQKAGTSAAGLTRQLLAFSRKQIIEPTLFDINGVVTDTRVMLERLIREDVKIVLHLQPDLARVMADRGQVEQILVNLAVNARDAMPDGGTLTIESAEVTLHEHGAGARQALAPGPYIVLTVSDTGAGMTPEVMARLFEPFFTTKSVGKGTGIGLATVDAIVTRSGGSVAVDSEVGKGTSIRVYFPRADGPDTAAAVLVPVPSSRRAAETVLLVEDLEALLGLVTRLLERRGYTVVAAHDADEAQRLFELNPAIDVLLTDVVLPGPSGPELTRRLLEQRPDLKVVYMSGYTADSIVHHGVLDPGIAFLHKPFTAQALGRKLREVLDA